ncbi:hypothetical protein GFS31_20270 [Leptolyngbya sp. BL0902]|uniref:caspase family protein n=1 Tax=Leptolyngbya sp. BL0902 TaxID=1115757 RepID=UPI00193665CB|nr:caspase family protein [Leptolyngbya sp. BL0902]QQE65340.1 hypothetical protein GFS31_20270 [Leptolyngbya sp. BL0902]
MPPIKRRHFLQAAGSTLAALGLSQTDFLRQTQSYSRALAQTTPRKLALLVGINQYSALNIPNLNGCVRDVEMQYEVLVHRYGFNPSDIVMLKDGSDLLPTRANILQAFEEHLIAQARPGDVVVFHYSGHGSRVLDPNPIVVSQCGPNSNPNGINGTLVPSDATFTRISDIEWGVTDIMGRSLFLLTQRLQTDQVCMVLDSCFSGAGTRGNAQVRSTTNSRLSNGARILRPSEAELDMQARWKQDLGLELDAFNRRRSEGIAQGIAIGSASCDQEAYELPFDTNAVAGAFTYLLTSYLWQLPAPESARTTQINLVRSTRLAAQSRGTQVPIFEAAPGSNVLDQPLYFANTLAPFAEGVVLSVISDQIELWLGGMSEHTLQTAQPGSVYALIDPATAQEVGDIRLESRIGLRGIARPVGTVNARSGLLVREKVAALALPTLRVGLDPSLAAEQQVATTALTSALSTSNGDSRVTVLPLDQQSNVAYVLARTDDDTQARLRQAGIPPEHLPAVGSIALYSADLSTVVLGTAGGAVNETSAAAVQRLRPRLRGLLAAQVLQSLAGLSSDLRVSGEIIPRSGQGGTVPFASRGSRGQGSVRTQIAPATYQSEELIDVRITNEESTPVYVACLIIDSSGNLITLHPARWDAPDLASQIAPGESLVVPRAEDGVQFRVKGAGFLEILTIISQTPLRGLLRNMQAIASRDGRTRGAVRFGDGAGDHLTMLDDLLGDVDTLSRSRATGALESRIDSQSTAVEAGAIAAFSTILEIVE